MKTKKNFILRPCWVFLPILEHARFLLENVPVTLFFVFKFPSLCKISEKN